MYILWLFLVLTACAGAGFWFFFSVFGGNPALGAVGALGGALTGAILELSVQRLRRIPARVLIGALIGLGGGMVVFALASSAVPEQFRALPSAAFAQFVAGLALASFGLHLGARKGEEFSLDDFAGTFLQRSSNEGDYKILDTSVIIDGRIADICETGFMDGTFIVPQFVLRELQHIADSSDSLKRNRGRRGLDILQGMQKKTDLNITITDQDFPKVREVDDKLIALAGKMKGKIVTNDFNLNKVAELNGVPVLNINLLANALKPVVLPGELMKVYVLREGKEANQGVAYLDDGTMVVVDNARRYIGKNVEVFVTSVLQTTAGRMIFTQMKEESRPEAALTSPAGEGAGR